MNAKRIVVSLALGSLAGIGWLTWRSHADTAELEQRLTEVQARRETLQAALRIPPPPMSASQVSATKNKTNTPDLPGKSATPQSRRSPPGLLDLARDNPELMNLFVANQRSEMQQRYGILFRKLQLTAAQQEKFKEVLAAGVPRGYDIGAVAKERGMSFDDPVIKQLHETSRKQLESELRSLLGDQVFVAYQEFERGLSVRGFVDGFAIQLATVEPLSAEQAEQLAQALIEGSPEFRRGERANPKTVEWTSVDRAAQRFLSPLQFASWQLGVAHNRAGGSRTDLELTRIYEAAKAKDAKPGN